MHIGGNSPFHYLKVPLLNSLSVIFKTLSYINLRRKGRRPRQFPVLIVSIDNLSFGGTGKTTLVTMIGEHMERKDIPFAVVTRGYKAKYEQTGTRVLPEHDFTDVGDEAVIYKTRFPRRDIFVGKDRIKSIEMAVERNNKIILLDDGFQSTNIQKDISVMLVNPNHPYYYLRNFKFLAKKEDFVFIYKDTRTGTTPDGIGVPYTGPYDFEPAGFVDTSGTPVETGNAALFGFSALGDNTRFKDELSAYNLAGFQGFPDHHIFTEHELKRLDDCRRKTRADFLVCTEKDFIKIKSIILPGFPLIYFRNSIKLEIDLMGYILDYAKKKNCL
jgi:tetraacyldisaccharide 4'-kinase